MPSRATLAGVILVLLFVVGLLFGLLQKSWQKPAPVWIEAKEVPFLEQEVLNLETPAPAPTESAAPTAIEIEPLTGTPTSLAISTLAPITPSSTRPPRTATPFPATPIAEDTEVPAGSPLPEDTEEPPLDESPTPAPALATTATPAAAGALAITRVTQTAAGDASEVRIELSDDVPEYRVFRVRNPARVIVDFEGATLTPGLAVDGDATALVKDVTTRYIANPDGTGPIGRVQIVLGDLGDKLPSVSESTESDALVITIRKPAL